MKATTLVVLMAIPVLLTGCQKPESNANSTATPARPPWQIKLDHFQAIVKIGMTEAEVTMAAGDPDRTVGDSTRVTWQYRLGDDNWFDVRFDKSNHVAVAELDGIKAM